MDRSITLHIFYWNDPYDMSCLHLYLGFGALSSLSGGVMGLQGFRMSGF